MATKWFPEGLGRSWPDNSPSSRLLSEANFLSGCHDVK